MNELINYFNSVENQIKELSQRIAEIDERTKQPGADLPLHINIAEMAGLLRMKPGTIRVMKCHNELPPTVNATGRPLWNRDEVLNWLQTRKKRRTAFEKSIEYVSKKKIAV